MLTDRGVFGINKYKENKSEFLMKTFKEFLEERALNIGNKSVSYPKFGNILILAGGAGSGKGFASNRMIAFEGKRFDVDAIKTSQLICQKSLLNKLVVILNLSI